MEWALHVESTICVRSRYGHGIIDINHPSHRAPHTFQSFFSKPTHAGSSRRWIRSARMPASSFNRYRATKGTAAKNVKSNGDSTHPSHSPFNMEKLQLCALILSCDFRITTNTCLKSLRSKESNGFCWLIDFLTSTCTLRTMGIMSSMVRRRRWNPNYSIGSSLVAVGT